MNGGINYHLKYIGGYSYGNYGNFKDAILKLRIAQHLHPQLRTYLITMSGYGSVMMVIIL